MNFLSLFSGIGGFDLALYNAGLKVDNHFFSEVDRHAVEFFRRHFPNARALGDVRQIDYTSLPRGDWIITGSPPCQPFSSAGKKKGEADSRNLFPETIRSIQGLRPCFAIFENVPGVLDYVDGKILPRIEDIGYKTETIYLQARIVGADHKRERLWIIAYPDGIDVETRMVFFRAETSSLFKRYNQSRFSPKRWRDAVCSADRGYDGVPKGVGIKCLGNAIVPQCAELFFMLPFFDKWREPGDIFSGGGA
ncbi:MAG: DNA (cytosine-5-)-methyltransferase [Spirochaetaceae bacterium]|jgi:DNA (cytosine-5)-methyltransferase 1|nr:DNA (cytosine-5-)-methyltransferase [Spirochaetaceae bacterium]